MKKSFLIICIFFTTTNLFSQNKPLEQENLVDKLGIQTATNRIFTFTNKAFGQFHGETNCYTNDGWRGWILREQKVFTDYSVAVNGKPLDRSKAKPTVFPYKTVRSFSNGVSEQLFFADSLDVLAFEYRNIKPCTFAMNGFNGSSAQQVSNFHISYSLQTVLPGYALSVISNSEIKKSPTDSASFTVPKPAKLTKIILFVHKQNDPLIDILQNIDKLVIEKRDRINSLLTKALVITNDKEFNKAYLWSVASFDALITTQESKGIFAGLPWFNNNWGRDTFISLPGCFASGNYEDAREILEAFAAYQDTIPDSKYYGRIPNRVTLKDIIYNTTDGTPWFVIQCENYFNRTADTAFIVKMYPFIKRAMQAALQKRTDKYGLLTHLDAETWMDAVGPDGPWSPRGNRANDIQVLWYLQLKATAKFAHTVEDFRNENFANEFAELVKQNITKFYIDAVNSRIADRLMPDGAADYKIRPNAFFVLNQSEFFPDTTTRINILKNLMQHIVMPCGVLSLDYEDANFHPYHEYPPCYPKDAAYHNGIIWQWNTGPVVDALCSFGLQDSAWVLTKELTRQILHDGAAGSIAELMEAMPRKGKSEIKLSGAFSQAWSLGEYLRTIHEQYFGIRTDVSANTIHLSPRLPKAINNATFTVRFGSEYIPVTYKKNNNDVSINIKLAESLKDITLDISINENGTTVHAVKNSAGSRSLTFSYTSASRKLTASLDNRQYDIQTSIDVVGNSLESKLGTIRFARIEADRTFPVLNTAAAELILHSTVKKPAPRSNTLIVNQSDPAGDEKYQYPQHPFFVKGILDIRNFSLSEDGDKYYFRLDFGRLVNPNWHAEYGFQLTFAGIYLNVDDDAVYSVQAGKNSKYMFPADRKFNRVIYVGGGFEIRDANNKIIAAYAPEKDDASLPLGNSKTGEISFCIPKKYIGKLSKSSPVSILSGAQDDHGGSGIGEFREVGKTAAEWLGGGKNSPDDDNVYDFLFIN